MANKYLDVIFKLKKGAITHNNRQSNMILQQKKLSPSQFGGACFIAGQFPGTVTVDGVPAKREIELRDRSTRKLVATTYSNDDGTYRFDNLKLNREFDLIARDYQRVYSDVIVPAVFAWSPLIIFKEGDVNLISYLTPEIKRTVFGGTPPYTLSEIEVPAGITVTLINDKLTIANPNKAFGTLKFQVSDINASKQVEIFITNLFSHYRIVLKEQQNTSEQYLGFTEIELLDNNDVDLTTPSESNTKATASSFVNLDNNPPRAFDNNATNSGWLSANKDQCWIQWVFDFPREVRKVSLVASWNHLGGTPKTFDIIASSDGANWLTLKSIQGETWTALQKRTYTLD